MYPVNAAMPPQSPRRRRWSRRKRLALTIVLLIIMAPIAATGYYLWDIARAIENVQDESVVELPTSDYKLGGVRQSGNPTEPTPTAEVAQVDQSGVEVTEVATDVASTNEPTNQSLTETVVSTATEEPEPTAAPTRSNPGSLDIARDLFGTGTRTDTVKPNDVWPDQDSINILVLGVDTRETGGDQNADVIMIARIDFTSNTVRVVSIPRDLYVEVPDHGMHKINGAYNIGVNEDPDSEIAGVVMMRDTIQYNFGIPIDEFVLVDFNGFEDIIDAVGGVTIDVPVRIEDKDYPTEDYGVRTLIIEAGQQNMDGETALAYARTRHQDSDDQRRERQMLVLRALLDKAQSLNSVTRISQIINATSDAILTSIDWKEQLALMNFGLNIHQNEIVMKNVTEPLVTPGTSSTGAWIYVGDPVEIGDFIEAVLSGNYTD